MSAVDIIELSEDEDDCVVDSIIIKNQIDTIYKKICNDNPVLTEFIETCFASFPSLSQSTAEHCQKDIERPATMKLVINTIFLKMYMKTDKEFRESKKFKKALRRSMNLIKSDFEHKYSHIKDICEILRTKKIKKRVPLVTLSNKLKDNEVSCQRKCETEGSSNISKIEIIDLDATENDLTIDLDSYESKVESHCVSLTGDKENDTRQNKIVHDNELLVPHKSIEIKEISPVDENTIKRIEEEIVQLKKKIAELDEQEVFDDNMNSPYIQSENYKARIVTLYKKLCKLTGVEAVKRSRVHLKVLEGHPAGPVRRLETFINSNIGSDCHPLFPNFRDVFKCVVNANEEDSLGWTKQKIRSEAIALFSHCGRVLQKRRQKREWRDLLSKVKVQRDPVDDDPADDDPPDDDPMDNDPADNDPSLLARLEYNRRRALRQETEILDRYDCNSYLNFHL
ncbi:unnamed protein product [Euphydryas editha]|uniref:Daxx histone-binding domain-containing protein n=1 Tax=Euphydryas editha TaxID=104508 RepID=A0AAU9T869_EUPED|nr:unnamed protein product [Euphydryas editha]